MTKRTTAPELDAALARLGDALARLSPQERDELRRSMPADIMALADQAGAAQAQSVDGARRG